MSVFVLKLSKFLDQPKKISKWLVGHKVDTLILCETPRIFPSSPYFSIFFLLFLFNQQSFSEKNVLIFFFLKEGKLKFKNTHVISTCITTPYVQ